jgi:hypothetical protein
LVFEGPAPNSDSGTPDVIMPPVLSGGTRSVRPERWILSIASFDATSRSLCVCTRRAASSGTAAPRATSIESRSAAANGADGANGLDRRGDEYHAIPRCGGGASRGDDE